MKVEGGLNDFLGCDILGQEGSNQFHILKPHLVNKLVKTFGGLVEKKRSTDTPGSPRKVQTRPKEKEDAVSKERCSEFRTGVGMLTRLLKHSRPELSNPIRELSKCM